MKRILFFCLVIIYSLCFFGCTADFFGNHRLIDVKYFDVSNAEALVLRENNNAKSIYSRLFRINERSSLSQSDVYKIVDDNLEKILIKNTDLEILSNINLDFEFVKYLTEDYFWARILQDQTEEYDMFYWDVLCNSKTGEVHTLFNVLDNKIGYILLDRPIKLVDNYLYFSMDSYGYDFSSPNGIYRVDISNPNKIKIKKPWINGNFNGDSYDLYVISDSGAILYTAEDSSIHIKFPNGEDILYDSNISGAVGQNFTSFGEDFISLDKNEKLFIDVDMQNSSYTQKTFICSDVSKILSIGQSWYLIGDSRIPGNNDISKYFFNIYDITGIKQNLTDFESKTINSSFEIYTFDAVAFSTSKILFNVIYKNGNKNNELICYDVNTNESCTIPNSDEYSYESLESLDNRVILSATRKSDFQKVLLSCDGEKIKELYETETSKLSICAIN